MGRIGSEEDAISRMKNLDASVHTRLAQRRARTGEDYNVLVRNGRWVNVVRLTTLLNEDQTCPPSLAGAVAASMTQHDKGPKWRTLAERCRTAAEKPMTPIFQRQGQPRCGCMEIVLSFLQLKDATGRRTTSLRDVPGLRYDYRARTSRHLAPGPSGTPATGRLLAALKIAYPSLDTRLELHHRIMQSLYARHYLAQVKQRLETAIGNPTFG